MPPARRLSTALDGLVDRALCVLGAVLASQAPEFMQQYLQRLGGHLDEARRQVAQFQHTAEQAGTGLAQFIQQTAANPDPGVARLGGVMQEAVTRADSLQAAQSALHEASLWTRPFVFLRHVDLSIAGATWHAFQPAVPTTAEGLAYALAGMLLLLGLYHFGVKPPLARLAGPKPSRAPAR